MPEISGYHHVNLTVADIDRSTAWYTDVMAFTVFKDFERDGYRKVIIVHPASRVAFGFTDHGARASRDTFSEFRTGMDHFAFTVPSRGYLDAWKERFEEKGVVHSEIKPSAMGDLIALRDPDNIQLELYAPSPET